ncbi:MAG: CehA/McbA family metallohydrolase domain-containing protein [Planctomycetota bacterium]
MKKLIPVTFVCLICAVAAQGDPTGFWATGDVHFHSKYSDGNAWPTDQVQTLRDRGLDYAFLTDHTCLLPQDGRQPQVYGFNGWDECASLCIPGVFLFAQGAEFTNAHDYNHTNCLPIYPPTFHHEQVGFTDYGNEGMMYREIHSLGGFAVVNHPKWALDTWTSYNFDGVTIHNPSGIFTRIIETHARGMDTMVVSVTDAHTLEDLASGRSTSVFVPDLTWESIRDAYKARHSYVTHTQDSQTGIALKVYRGETYLGMQGDSIIAEPNETLTFKMTGYMANFSGTLRLFYITADDTTKITEDEVSISQGDFEHSVDLPMTEDRIYYAGVINQTYSSHLRVKIRGKPDWHNLCGTWRWQNDRFEQLDTSDTFDVSLMKTVTRDRVIPFDERPHQVITKVEILDLTGNADERIGLIGHRSFFPGSQGDRTLVLNDQTLWLFEEAIDNGVREAFTYNTGDVIWLKMRFEGDWIQGKAWHDGESEPNDWLISRNLSDHEFKSGGPTGKAGLYCSRARAAFDEFAVLDDDTGQIIAQDTFNSSDTPVVAPDPDLSPRYPADFNHFPTQENLLINPGAETGDVSGWTLTGNCSAIASETCRWGPDMQPKSGASFFLIGPDYSPSMSFEVDLAPYVSYRKSGTLRYLAGTWSASHTDYDDDPISFTVNQYDACDIKLESRSTGWLYDWFQGRWNEFPMAGLVHPLTTRLEFVVSAMPKTDGEARAYADDLYFYLGTGQSKMPIPSNPVIVLDTTSIIKSVIQYTEPDEDTFTVRNGGVDVLEYTIQCSQPWLRVGSRSGDSNDCSDIDTIIIAYAGGLALGSHFATIDVIDPNALNNPQSIQIELLVIPIPADFDADGDVDQEDFGHLQKCISGTGIAQNNPECLNARLDGDLDVDIKDYNLFKACISGANIPADPNCAN